ncbi:MAG TPA: metallophosphoesterase [Gemmataceae bacterium]|nr:metallophosphoesterase [Gemmataceae bacterium]
MSTKGKRVRVAALADLHCGKTVPATFQPLFRHINNNADIFLLCGDLTDHGLLEEGEALVRELKATITIPMLAVLGNHDWHSGKQVELEQFLEGSGIHVLDGDDCEIHGIGFTGVKGFGGGFGRHTLEAWGEDAIKRFVYEAVEEALKLEKSLARLGTPQKIAMLHYAPIQATVEGEPPPIFPFLGSSRLEEPLNRWPVTVVFHGHAHHGSPEGRTKEGVPVYNVALPVLRDAFGDVPPVRILEVPLGKDEG